MMKNKISLISLVNIAMVFCVLVGVCLVLHSYSLAEFTDKNAAMEWFWISRPIDLNREASAEFNENWHMRMNEFRTHKWALYDSGISLAVFGGLSLFTLQICKLCSVFSLSQIQTPKRKITLIVLGLIGFAFMIAGMVHEITLIMNRYEAPHWADSSAIPLYGISMFAKQGFVLIVVLGITQLCFLDLRAHVFKRYLISPWWSLIIWTPYGLLAMLFLVGIFDVVYAGGFIAIPGFMIWIYVVLSTRAGLELRLSKRKQSKP